MLDRQAFVFFKLMLSVLGATDKECGQKIYTYCEPLEKVRVRVRVRFGFSNTRLNQRPIQPVTATVSYLLSSLCSCAKLTSLDQTHFNTKQECVWLS